MKRKKYGNRSCYSDGIRFDSALEAEYYNQLKLLKKAGHIRDFSRQVTFRFYVNEKLICSHRVDFLVVNSEGSEEVHEVKGFATDVWNIKRKLFEALYPEIPYKVVN